MYHDKEEESNHTSAVMVIESFSSNGASPFVD